MMARISILDKCRGVGLSTWHSRRAMAAPQGCWPAVLDRDRVDERQFRGSSGAHHGADLCHCPTRRDDAGEERG
jgi:hypothetical protein